MDTEKTLRSHRFDTEIVDRESNPKLKLRWYIDCLVDGKLESLEVGEIENDHHRSLIAMQLRVSTIRRERSVDYYMDFIGEFSVVNIIDWVEDNL